MKLSMDGSDSEVPVPQIQKINLRHNVSETANTTIYSDTDAPTWLS
jgi:hypothetical protein